MHIRKLALGLFYILDQYRVGAVPVASNETVINSLVLVNFYQFSSQSSFENAAKDSSWHQYGNDASSYWSNGKLDTASANTSSVSTYVYTADNLERRDDGDGGDDQNDVDKKKKKHKYLGILAAFPGGGLVWYIGDKIYKTTHQPKLSGVNIATPPGSPTVGETPNILKPGTLSDILTTHGTPITPEQIPKPPDTPPWRPSKGPPLEINFAEPPLDLPPHHVDTQADSPNPGESRPPPAEGNQRPNDNPPKDPQSAPKPGGDASNPAGSGSSGSGFSESSSGSSSSVEELEDEAARTAEEARRKEREYLRELEKFERASRDKAQRENELQESERKRVEAEKSNDAKNVEEARKAEEVKKAENAKASQKAQKEAADAKKAADDFNKAEEVSKQAEKAAEDARAKTPSSNGQPPRNGQAPKPDSPKPDSPKPDSPKPDSPKPDSPKYDSPKYDSPKYDFPKYDSPKADSPKPDSPKPDSPKPDSPKPDSSKPDTHNPYNPYDRVDPKNPFERPGPNTNPFPGNNPNNAPAPKDWNKPPSESKEPPKSGPKQNPFGNPDHPWSKPNPKESVNGGNPPNNPTPGDPIFKDPKWNGDSSQSRPPPAGDLSPGSTSPQPKGGTNPSEGQPRTGVSREDGLSKWPPPESQSQPKGPIDPYEGRPRPPGDGGSRLPKWPPPGQEPPKNSAGGPSKPGKPGPYADFDFHAGCLMRGLDPMACRDKGLGNHPDAFNEREHGFQDHKPVDGKPGWESKDLPSVDEMNKASSSLEGAVDGAMEEASEGQGKKVTKFWGKVKKGFKSVWDGVCKAWEMFNKAWEEIMKPFKKLWDAIKKAWKKFLSLFKKAGKQGGFWGKVAGVFENCYNGIKNSWVWRNIIDSKVGKFIRHWYPKMVKKVASVTLKVLDVVGWVTLLADVKDMANVSICVAKALEHKGDPKHPLPEFCEGENIKALVNWTIEKAGNAHED